MEERRKIVFDNKIPLTWILSSAASILFLLFVVLWNIASQSSKLDQLIIQSQKEEQNNVNRDAKMDSLVKESYDSKRNIELQNLRLESLERSKVK